MDEIKRRSLVSSLKKSLKEIAVLVAICLVFNALLIISFTSWEEVKVNNINISYSKVTKNCIATYIEWDGDTDNMTFTVPDEYEGLKVKSLGGTVGSSPTLFYVTVPEKMSNGAVSYTDSEECAGIIDENTVTYKFTVNLGKNVKNFEHFHYEEYHEDENDKVVYIVKINYECSPENKWVYSKDGKIYDKKTDELIVRH